MEAKVTTIDGNLDKTLYALSLWASEQANAFMNNGQPEWLTLADDSSSVDAILSGNLKRDDLNKTFEDAYRNADQTARSDIATLIAQHDYLAAVGRDYVESKQSRLAKIYFGIGDYKQQAAPGGTIDSVKRSLLRGVQ